MERETAPQKIIFDIARHVAVDALERTQARQIGRNAQHVAEVQERSVCQFNEPLLENRAGARQKMAITLDVGRIDAFDLAQHRRLVGAVVEVATGVIVDAVEGMAWAEFDILLTTTPRSAPQVVEQERRRDHRRTGIEAEAVHL